MRFATMRRARALVVEAGVPYVDLGDPPAGVDAAIDAHIAETVVEAMRARKPGAHRAVPLLPDIFAAIASGEAMARCFGELEAAMLPALLAAMRPGGAAAGADVVVGDYAALAAQDAAEKLGLPLALLWQAPLGLSLMHAGEDRLNLSPRVPLEVAPGVLTMAPAKMSPPRLALNAVCQVILRTVTSGGLFNGRRVEVRAAYGLPPPAADSTGIFCVPEAVPRVIHAVSCVEELVRAWWWWWCDGLGGEGVVIDWLKRMEALRCVALPL